MAISTALPYLFIWVEPFIENCGSHTGSLRIEEAYAAKDASVPNSFNGTNLGYKLTQLVSDRMDYYVFHAKISWIYLSGGSCFWYGSKSVVLNQGPPRGHLAISEDTFSFHSWRGGWYWHSWERAQDVANPRTLHRIAPHYRELSGKMSRG